MYTLQKINTVRQPLLRFVRWNFHGRFAAGEVWFTSTSVFVPGQLVTLGRDKVTSSDRVARFLEGRGVEMLSEVVLHDELL